MARKILIVDDSAINRQLLINTLSKDYDILEAENGAQAFDLMNHYYKLLSAVLLDIVMPEMDGYEVLRRARDNAVLSQIPIIIVTGSEDEESRVTALALGANDFILKPFNPDIIKHCLKNNIALRETASILNAIQKDKLTGLYNREAFFEKVNAMIKDREPDYYILSCFDIDNFKLINDQYGAMEGDRILKDIGRAVRLNMDELGGIAGRISADNFATLSPRDRREEDILRRLEDKTFTVPEHQSIVFSIGRYLISDPTLQASAIYDRAYIAKQSVKGRYDKHYAYFDETMLENLVRDQQIIGEMETALTERQFEVWFQPQYNHVTGAVIGAEALVRWRHPKKGIVPPGEFIPLFEQNGFVYELDKYVWREVCRYLRKWMDAGLNPLPVSVNISRYDIFRADLIDVITGLTKEFRIPVNLLCLEITESAFAKSPELIVRIVKELISLGFTVEIDDFGSGYSSLNTLRNVPAQVVKLDMRFLEDGDDAQRGGNILESIVRMTKWLGMSVIAEGVETKEQGDFLKSIGCSHVQGYLYARPMPAGDYRVLFAHSAKEGRAKPLVTVDNLDNNRFWNPNSMDTLIFNSYVGAACIFEYHDGNIELIRVTDKYTHMLADGKITSEDLLRLDLMKYLDEASKARTAAMLSDCACGSGEKTDEFLFLDLPGCPHETYLRSTMRVIASTQDRYLVYCISENITAQRISERKARSSARQLKILVDNINCGVTALAVNGEKTSFLLANDKFYELLGYTRRQYENEIGDYSYPFVFPADRAHVAQSIGDTAETGVPSSMEYRVTRRDGSVVWLRSFISITDFDEIDGRVQLCTYTNITAENRSTKELLDNLPCGAGICVVSGSDAHMTYLNKRYLSYFKSDVRQRSSSVFDFVHPDDCATLRKTMQPPYFAGNKGSCVVRIMDAPGKYISFRLSGIAIESDGGNSIYVVFIPIEAEDASFSAMLPVVLEAMMASSPDLAFVKDRELRYICCSRPFAKMVGFESEKDIIGKTDYDLFDASFAEQYVADDHALLKSGKSIVDMVEHIPSDDGRTRFSSTSKYLLYDSAGNAIGLYGVGRDITRAREAELQQKFLINSIPGGVAIYEGVWSTLESINLTYFSDGFCSLFGYTREEYEKLGSKNPTGLVAAENLPELIGQIENLIKNGKPIDYIYKARRKDGGYRWIHIKAVLGESHGKNQTVNALLFDVTDRQEALERLRISEEESRLAIQHSGNIVCRYDIASKSLRLPAAIDPMFEISQTLSDIPYSQVLEGKISPETADAYIAFYESILRGDESGSQTYQRSSVHGWRWIDAHFSTIFSSGGAPVSAVISFSDATESYEKDAAYRKWLQSIQNKDPLSYSLFRCNVSKKSFFDTVEGSLLNLRSRLEPFSFESNVSQYAIQNVFDDDCDSFRSFLSAESLLEKYHHGDRIITLEYREKLPEGDYRWLRLTVDMVEYAHSSDIEAYLLFENIDDAKRARLLTIERAETDPLTGVLNRTTFAEKVDFLIHNARPGTQHAMLMLDIDGFKLVNDAFGHGAGDQTLIDIANLLRASLRHDDLICRLGGDEFLVFLSDIPGVEIAALKARQICDLTRKAYSAEVRISGSVGITLCPQDGADFKTLYEKVDETLYHVKGAGRDNYAFYREGIEQDGVRAKPDTSKLKNDAPEKAKRRMLIVDDSRLDCEMLANMFAGEYLIEQVYDGNTALVRLRHYGSSIAVVLLDLMMPGMDGFAVLDKIQQSPDMRSIPVIVVSGDNNRDTSLKAIRAGAADFVMKPVDSDVLRIRVESAISRAENERLRAINSFLELQSSETTRYEAVLSKIGLPVAEISSAGGTFMYCPFMSKYLAGKYDSRDLWSIFTADSVAGEETVSELQRLAGRTADGNDGAGGSVTVPLLASCGETHLFCVSAFKLASKNPGRAGRIVLTFKDTQAQ